MKTRLLIFFLLISFNLFCHQIEFKKILKNSGIRIIHTSVAEVSVILKKIDGNKKVFTKIDYDLICKKGKVSLKTSYFYYFQKPQIINVQINPDEYVDLWKAVYKIGLSDLASLPLDSAIDPFEFIDSWRTEKDTFRIEFRIEDQTNRFFLYDIGAYRDKRFKILIEKILEFLDEKNNLVLFGRQK